MGEHKITRSGVAERSLLRADQWRPEPSPTGRDAAGLLSRKITGEVLSEAAQRPEATGEALDRIRKEIYPGGGGFGLTITRRSEFASCLAQLSFFPARGCPHRSRVESGIHTAAR